MIARTAKRRLRQTGETLLIMATTTGIAFLVRPARGEVSGALVFVLGIIWAGTSFGLGQALLASSLSFLLYNFYFAEPVLTFRVDTLSDLTPLLIFNASAGIAGILAGRLRDQAEAAASANRGLTALLGVSRALQSALTFADIEAALADTAGRAAGIRELRVVPLPVQGEVSRVTPARLSEIPASAGSRAISLTRIALGQQAWDLAIAAPAGGRGADAAGMAALVNLVALALERASLSEKIAEAEAMSRAEELESSLLSSVSHDFRTPLATISASASSLLEFGDRLELGVASSFLRTILEESERLNRYTANLLEMTRLEAGHAPVGQPISVSDIVGSCLRRIRPRVGARVIEREDDCDCLVLAEPTLFELAVGNVLENALLYSDDATRIRVSIRTDEGRCVVEIADQGEGIPPHEMERIFDRFYRIDRSQRVPQGTGLGLAIARGFVSAVGGTIAARVPGIGDRGTTIRIELPLVGPEPR